MSRSVEAVLLWLTEAAGTADPTPAAKEFGQQVSVLLHRRFDQQSFRLVEHQENDATKKKALKSLQDAVDALKDKPEGLLVLAFSGHGKARGDNKLSWVLRDLELTEGDIYDALAPLPSSIELVLISDCCYGSAILPFSVRFRIPTLVLRWWPGLAIPEPAAVARIERRVVAFAQRLSKSTTDGGPTRNVICIASTNLILVRVNTTVNAFARCLRQAVVPSPPTTYEQVDDEMKRIRASSIFPNSQESWRVVCQPPEAGKLPPFRQ